MKHLTFLLLSGGLLAAPALAANSSAHDGAAHASADNAAAAPAPAPKLQAALRGLWHGHVQHTRDYAFAVKAGDLSDQVEDVMAAAAAELVQAGAEAIIAGCSEVPIVLDPGRVAVPLIDATEALAQACVAACG